MVNGCKNSGIVLTEDQVIDAFESVIAARSSRLRDLGYATAVHSLDLGEGRWEVVLSVSRGNEWVDAFSVGPETFRASTIDATGLSTWLTSELDAFLASQA